MKRILVLVALLAMTQGALADEKSVAKKAGRGIEKGADATVKGLKKAGEWIGKAAKKGGEKLEKASK